MEKQEDEVASEMGLMRCICFDILIKELVTGGVLFPGTLLGGVRRATLGLDPGAGPQLTASLKAVEPPGSHLLPA